MPKVQCRGLNFHVQHLNAGAGRPVILIHGLVMDNLASWYFTLAPAIAARREVLLYDLRGHGRSDRPTVGYDRKAQVADLSSILDAVGIEEPVTLIGNSFGGYIAVEFALAHPARTAAIALVDGHIAGEGWGEAMATTLSLQGSERDRVIAEHFQSWLGRHSARKRNRLAASARSLVEETTLLEDLKTSPRIEDSELAAIHCPLLAIYGERSDILEHAHRLARCIPQTDLRTYPDCSHSVIWQATPRLQSDVLNWLDRTASEHVS